MNRHHRILALAAGTLAASLLVTACGGGDAQPPSAPVAIGTPPPAPDTTPPTVTIADDVGAGDATGPVTFTFLFSEDVGSSFDATDVDVVGGAKGAFTKVSAKQYTLLVTPNANAKGTITVTVAASKFSDLAGNINTASASQAQTFNTVVSAPTTAAPTPPARAAADVKSIYSNAYAPIAGLDLNPNWGQSTVPTDVTIAGDQTRKYANLNYQGIDWASNPIDVSTFKSLHIDLWTADVTSVKVSLISPGGKENAVELKPALSTWSSYDIDLTQYTVPDKTQIFQVKIEGTPAGGTLFFDNLYIWKAAAGGGGGCGTTVPTCAPSTVIPAGSTVIYSDAGNTPSFLPNPDWSQSPPVGFSEVTIASNKSLKYVFTAPALYEGLDWASNSVNVSTKGMLHVDLFSPDITSVKVSLIGGGSENGITKTVTPGSWNAIDIDLALFTSPDKTKIIQMKLEPNVGGTLYVDNIYFYGTAAGGGGGGGTFTGGIFASDYLGNLSASTAKSKEGGSVGFFLDPRLFAGKVYDAGDVSGSAANPGGVPNFWYGVGKAATPVITDGYLGAYVNAPGNGSADASAYSKVTLKFWGDAESWERNNFTANVDVLIQGPTNAACTNASGRPELTRTVPAQKIGAGSSYTILKSDFTLTASCGGAYTVNSVWAAIGAVVVRLANTNIQYVNAGVGTPVAYPTFINVGPITFSN